GEHHCRRGVVPGTGEQVDVVPFLACDAIWHERRTELSRVDRRGWQRLPYAFGSSSGAGRVVHDGAETSVGWRADRLPALEFVVLACSADRPNAEHALARESRL